MSENQAGIKGAKTLNIVSVTNDDTVKVLAHLYTLALNGEIKGVCVIAERDHYTHKISITGEYKRDPNIARIPAEKLLEQIISRAKSMERYTEITIEDQ